MNQYAVYYHCKITRKHYTQYVDAQTPQDAVNKTRELCTVNEVDPLINVEGVTHLIDKKGEWK